MKERSEPQHDYIFCRRTNGEEQLSKGGIIMPEVADPTGNKRSSGRLEVVAVGPGPWVDVAEKGQDAKFLRRPMSCKVGDHIIVQGGGFLFNVDGEQVMVVQDYQVCAVIRYEPEEEPAPAIFIAN